jgi:predicted nucleotidyltransferase
MTSIANQDIAASPLGQIDAPSPALIDICRRCFVERLEVFGSVTTSEAFDPARSDLDVLVSFRPLAPAAYAQAYFTLRDGLETLSGRPVDLLTDASLKNPHLRQRIDAERKVLFSVS